MPGAASHGLDSLCPCGPNPNATAPPLPYRVDYWDGEGPAHALWDDRTYDAYDYGSRAVQIVQEHNTSENFFLYWAPHKVHSPLQAAPEFLEHYPLDPGHRCTSTPDKCLRRGWGLGCGCSGMCYCNRRIFRAMLSSVDAMLANLTSAMEARGLWQDTLVFFLGDNGGPSSAAANNGEFKGMKFGHWEGGHRVPSFVGGPALAPSLRAQWYNQTVHLVDLHRTILDLVGLAPQHPAGVAAHDGVSLLPVLDLSISLATPIRRELWIGDDVLRIGDLKIITGAGTESTGCMVGIGGNPVGLPLNSSDLSNYCGSSSCSGKETGADALICGECKCASYSGVYSPEAHCTPCVFDVRADPGERHNLAALPQHADQLASMTARLLELKKSEYMPTYPPDNLTAACAAMVSNGGFFGPWAVYEPPPPPPPLNTLFNNTRLVAHYNIPATFVCATAERCLAHCEDDSNCGAIAYSEPYQPLKIPLPGCPGQRPGIDGCCFPSPLKSEYVLLPAPGYGTYGYVSAIVRYANHSD